MNLGTASDLVSEERSGMAISVIRSAVEPGDHRAPATGAVALSNELLRVICDGLDVRDVFPRIARTAGRLLQHDCLDLVVYDPFGNAMLRTRSAEEFPEDQPGLVAGRGEFCVVRDLQEVASHDAGWAPRPFVEGLAAAGYQSFLCIRARARERVIRLGFFSRRREAYVLDDVPVARLIADCIAVVVAHEELAEAQRTRVDARVHADRLDSRIRTLTETSEWQAGVLRVVGQSPEWRQVLRIAAQVASTDTTVFVQGESGTGKEVVARFIHRASPRKTGPFVAINCAALPEQLLESELFGFERGAFTGAHQAKAGQIELASTGVLFLDEVSEMSPPAQAKLLRVLQEREFQRLGGTRPIKANVRVIAASNRDLQRAVADGSFREDLFYRLQVFDIHIPPLRERRRDIPLLTDAFLQEFNRSTGCSSTGLSPEAREMLFGYEWPGNVRELHNALERAAILCQGGLITGEHLSLRATSFVTPRRPSSLSDVERRTIEQILRETDGNKSKAARRLGITRTQLYGRLRKYELEPA
jgi:transcriptional regulator with GAF, ATPase, and Fis domain